MKKLIVLIIAILLSFGAIVGCGEKPEGVSEIGGEPVGFADTQTYLVKTQFRIIKL